MPLQDWADAFCVEYYVVQRRFPDPGWPLEWVDVPQTERADQIEAHDLADQLREGDPRAHFKVVRRWRSR